MNELKQNVLVKEGGVIELAFPELRAGLTVEVTVRVLDDASFFDSMSSIIGSGKGLFGSVAEIDEYLQRERDSWDC